MALLDKEILSQRNKEDLQKVKDIIAEYGLVWNWSSIYYTIYEKNKDWDSLRVYDGTLNNTLIILMAGMQEATRSKDRAFEVLTKVSEAGIHPMRLHRFLDEILQEKHFFTDITEEEAMANLVEADNQEMKTLERLIYSVISKQGTLLAYQEMLQNLKETERASMPQ